MRLEHQTRTNYSGRFLSPDWSKTPEDVPYADLDNPQSLNLYSYVKNNPLSQVDKDGHCAEDACVVEGGVTAGILIYGAAVGTAAYFNTPSGQRSLDTFTSAAGSAISGAFHGITSLFSSSGSSSNTTPAPAPAAAPSGQQVPATAPGFIGDAGGNVVQIPAGSTIRPADNGNGLVYQPPVAPGQHPDADAVRVMGPHAHQPTGLLLCTVPTGGLSILPQASQILGRTLTRPSFPRRHRRRRNHRRHRTPGIGFRHRLKEIADVSF